MTFDQTTQKPTFTLSKTSLVLTRPYEDSKRVFKDYNAIVPSVIISPCQRVVKTNYALVDSNEDLCNHNAFQKASLIITSHNALYALTKTPRDTPIFCVGNYTKQELNKLGFECVTQFETANTLQQYLMNINEHDQDRHFLFLSSQKVSIDFENTIPNCRRMQVYAIEPILLQSKEVQKPFQDSNLVIFPVYSHHSLQNLNKFLTLNDVYLKNAVIIAMSEACTRNTDTHHYKDVVIAQKPDHQSMLQALRDYVNKQDFENG